MKNIIKLVLAAAVLAMPLTLTAGEVCKKCCKDSCAACCKEKGKECGKTCCKSEK